ncbi:MAG: hypothetical protein ACI8R4_000294 [Paracoccaceae bacterium]|jgi:hypothetical protein
MQLVPSSILALAAILMMFVKGPRRGVFSFLALTPFGAAAAFNLPALGGATIGLKELAVVAVFVMVWIAPDGPNRLLGTLRPGQPGFVLLILMAVCGMSAIFAPMVFRGATEVFSLSREANAQGIISISLRPTTGNITQLFMMTLSALAFLCFATVFRVTPDARAVLTGMAIATGINFVLGWLDVVTGATGLNVLMEPIRTANYSMLDGSRMAGIKRMVGGFPEASSFGEYSLTMFAFWLPYWTRSPSSWLARIMLVASAIVLLRSTSSGAYVALVLFLLGYGLYAATSGTRSRVPKRVAVIFFCGLLTVWMAALVIYASYQLVDPVTAFFDQTLFDKLETDSGIERMSWNTQALRNFTDTTLVGAGLGSVRASNWFVACLGSIGLIGTLLYLAFLTLLARLPVPSENAETAVVVTGLKSACFALFIAAFLTSTTPNLGVFFFTLAGLATGLSRGASLTGQTVFDKRWSAG